MLFTNCSGTGATAWVPDSNPASIALPFEYTTMYISGPMTGYPDANYAAFHAAEKYLVGLGCEVLNPARNFNGILGLPRETYMRRDVELLLRATGLYVLQGWQESAGALLEHDIAQELGLLIIYQEPLRADVFAPGYDDWYESTLDTRYDQPVYLTPPEPKVIGSDGFPLPYQETAQPRAESTLEEAQRLIHGDRNVQYGHPLDDFTRTGRMIGAILGTPDVSAEKVGLILNAVKTSRAVNELDAERPVKRDTLVDGPGYWGCVDMVQAERTRREEAS